MQQQIDLNNKIESIKALRQWAYDTFGVMAPLVESKQLIEAIQKRAEYDKADKRFELAVQVLRDQGISSEFLINKISAFYQEYR